MRIAWNGSLGFGLVNIPVGVAPATKAAARQSDVSFRLLHRECLTPVKQKRWCPHHDRELASDEIVRGLEVTKGQFVVVEDAELEAIEQHDDSRVIEIQRFVPAAEVDPAWMDRTYFLVPGQAPAQRRPYRLLLQAMRETETGALGRFVRSGRESLCLVRPRGGALALETLFLAEDVYSQAEIEEAVEATETKAAELDLARQIVQGLAGPFEPELLTSAYRRDLRALLDAKSRGESIAPAPRDAEPAPMGDLLEALKASVEAAKASAAPKARRAAKKASTAAAAAPAAKKAPGRGSTRR